MVTASDKRRIIETRLPAGQSLARYVSKRRRLGMGWRRIADELLVDTGEVVSFATLRRWFPEKSAPAAPPADELESASVA